MAAEVKAGIERQTVLGKIERRKLFDAADDGFSHFAASFLPIYPLSANSLPSGFFGQLR